MQKESKKDAPSGADIELNNEFSARQKKIAERHQLFLLECSREGATDGAMGIPIPEETVIPPSELVIVAHYQVEIESLFSEENPMLDTIRNSEYQSLEMEIKKMKSNPQIITNDIQQLSEGNEKRKAFIKNEYADREKNVHREFDNDSAKHNFENASRVYIKQSQNMGGREMPNNAIKPLYAMLFLVVMGICEIPLNIQVFQMFRGKPMETLIMACTLVIVLPVLAHAIGKFVKQRKEKKLNIYLAIGLLLLFIFFNYYVTQLRNTFIISRGGASGGSGISFYVFFFLGLLLFLFGAVVSFFAHDENSQFMKAYKGYLKAKKVFDLKKGVLNTSISALHKEKIDRLNHLENESDSKNELLNNQEKQLIREKNAISGKHNSLLDNLKGLEQFINQSCKQAVQTYRRENFKTRGGLTQPIYWQNPIQDLTLRFHNINELPYDASI